MTSGRISIRNLEFQGRHGATAAERKTLRRFQVDVDVELPPERAARVASSDRLADTVDYHAIATLVEALGTGKAYHLIEALGGAILAALVERWPQCGLAVEVRKLNPPCPGNPACAAVRLERARP